MPIALRKPWLSPQDYLAAEQVAGVRHEYVDGEVFAMGGGSLRHNEITLNIVAALRAHARDRGCRTYSSDVKVRVDAANAYYYPDVVVACAPPDGERYVINVPTLIVEVLSDSTEAVDRREKRVNYQRIPSLREIVLVSQSERLVEVYRRDGDRWAAEVTTDGEVRLASLELILPLDEIYR